MLENLIKRAKAEYYNGTPIMSDEIFDHLVTMVTEESIGYKSSYERRYKHLFPLFSLQKVIQGVDSPPNWGNDDFIVTPKLDGAAISMIYGGGEFQKALTRGDGIEGLDITYLIRTLVPNKINYNDVIQISGEVVAPKEIPNARNYAAGALNLKDSNEFATRDLHFVAHGVSPYITDNYVSDMREISNLGFDTAIDSDYSKFPQDGSVFRIAMNDSFDAKGYTSHHPRGAFALKKQETGVVTVLQDVTWQVGKSGAVSPVAHFEPINIEGATVSKATLHNKSIIEALDLKLGCKIEVIRAGKIIPQVVRRVD
jgi:NAD-dependent DNA ligase